ncbi:conserved hypothetical protein [Shewanella denitrificans OS217]|jgi:hypothetical protein|uniref:Uncharacterized protein n=1 Tax=Shewanella denitrificans (strain OS217 / ATCC BAA-1090 / DSM 15013) TaxID=318161 RepID=Q12R64_SHEDO|nr:conserved hypothetical protein [Shewanella denitrificans OS217]
MITPNDFIETKAPQLAYYGKAFLDNQLDYEEVKLYMWDVLEEWQCVNYAHQSQFTELTAIQTNTETDTEKVFWHLLHCFDTWSEMMIRGNQYLRQQVNECCDYINLGGEMPLNCVGVRP